MKRFFCCILVLLLALCSALPAQGLPAVDFPLPFTREALLSALYEADISSLRRAISLELITCEELTAYYLDRIAAYNETYNCFITLCDDALDMARQRDAQFAQGEDRGLLFGIPIVIKDNMDLEGYPTTNGYSKSKAPTADSNAWVVDRLLEEGAVILGKANMSTGAQDARVSYSLAAGTTHNAYNPLLAAGGSSGGSAVAAALNFAAAALGTDTNSSLRMPAVLNGCVALRGTFGLIPRDGLVQLNRTRDIAGAITRSVYDLALMMDVLTENAFQYAQNLDSRGLEGKRLGILTQLVRADDEDTDPEVLAAFDRAVEELRQCGAEIITVSMPDLFKLSDPSIESNKQALKDALYAEYQALLETHALDAVIFPTYSSTPIRHGTDENGKYWDAWEQPFLNNCRALSPSAQVPEISLVIGYHSLGAGIGMEIAADKNCEQLLLDMAYAYTLRFDHRQTPAGAPDAYAQHNAGTLAALAEQYLDAREAATAPTTVPTEPSTAATEPQPSDTTPETPASEPLPEPQPSVPAPPEPAEPQPIWLWLAAAVGAVTVAGAMVIGCRQARRAARRRKRQQRRKEVQARVRRQQEEADAASPTAP